MRCIAIRKEPNGSLYMSKHFFERFTENDLGVYHYTKVELTDEEFENVSIQDFVIDGEFIYFSTELQEKRLAREKELEELPELQAEMDEISKDIIQMMCGAFFSDKEERIARFRIAHNRYREITGKAPRVYQ